MADEVTAPLRKDLELVFRGNKRLIAAFESAFARIVSLADDTASVAVDIDDLDTRVSDNESDIIGLDVRVTDNESDIATLQTDLGTANSAITALDGRLTTAEGEIDALDTRMDAAESDIDDLETDVTAIQGQLAAGVSGSFTTVDGKTVTVTGGIVTSIV